MMNVSPTSDENQLMTSSYHEINDPKTDESDDKTSSSISVSDLKSINIPKAKKFFDKARNWVGDLSLEGMVSQEGQQFTYVTQDFAEKIKLASPISSPEKEDPSEKYQEEISRTEDYNELINDIEQEAKRLATSIDNLTENLTGILHSISSMTVDCIYTASDGVTQLCDTADSSIKVMYQVMAKCEELNKSVRPIYKLHQEVKNTKRLLDKVESELA